MLDCNEKILFLAIHPHSLNMPPPEGVPFLEGVTWLWPETEIMLLLAFVKCTVGMFDRWFFPKQQNLQILILQQLLI